MAHLLIGGLALALLASVIGAVLALQPEHPRLRQVGFALLAVSAALAAAILMTD